MKISVIGGGAAGFFAALAAKESNPSADVHLFERSNQLLSKVRISGGGRCNVTHACFDPKLLVQNYPRGHKELLGPFHTFGPKETIAWLEARGVSLKTEADGRIFPTTDSSQTIIDCFLREAERLGVTVHKQAKVESLDSAQRIIVATGSNKSGWEMAQAVGHTIQTPVPSLFTFNIEPFPLAPLSGIAVEKVKVHLEKMVQEGPLLITHWGFSGPSVLKLSAFGARTLAEKNYRASISIDWLPGLSEEAIRASFEKEKATSPNKTLENVKLFPLPARLWKALCEPKHLRLNDLGKSALLSLARRLKCDHYEICGKTTYKEEFVTCGGVTLSEIDFKTMESKLRRGLFFCGEILDIDGVTGGFNFQNAWTTGYLAGQF